MTIICNSSQFIFVHLHKCAGTSIREAIRPHLQWNDLMLGGNHQDNYIEQVYRERFGLEKHNNAYQLHTILGEAWNNYWTFSIVRHPAEYLESFYHWSADVVTAHAATHDIPVEEFTRMIVNRSVDDEIINWSAIRFYCSSSDFQQFIETCLATDVFPLNKTLSERLTDNNHQLVDDIFQLERLHELADHFAKRTGLSLSLKHNNISSKKTVLWTKLMLQKVYKRFQKDYRIFDYSVIPDGLIL